MALRSPGLLALAAVMLIMGCGGNAPGAGEISVPDFTGRSVERAACDAHRIGLRPLDRSGHDLVETESRRCVLTRAARNLSHPDATVAEQTPRAGAHVARGTPTQIVTRCQLGPGGCL